MANPEHTRFYCVTNPKNGQPFALQFDPAMLSDEAIRVVLINQINYASMGNVFVKMITFDSHENLKKSTISLLMLSEKYNNSKERLVTDLFSEIRKADVVKVRIIRTDVDAVAKKFIDEGMSPELSYSLDNIERRQSAFEKFINTEVSSADAIEIP